jgi:putative membrane protein
MEKMNTHSDGKAGDHLANERTYLAWIRTSIGIMAFGFVVVKFSLFVKQLSLILGKKEIIQAKGYSSVAGIILVSIGAITTFLSYLRYLRVEKQLREEAFRNSALLITVITSFILGISMFLVVYLIFST